MWEPVANPPAPLTLLLPLVPSFLLADFAVAADDLGPLSCWQKSCMQWTLARTHSHTLFHPLLAVPTSLLRHPAGAPSVLPLHHVFIQRREASVRAVTTAATFSSGANSRSKRHRSRWLLMLLLPCVCAHARAFLAGGRDLNS